MKNKSLRRSIQKLQQKREGERERKEGKQKKSGEREKRGEKINISEIARTEE